MEAPRIEPQAKERRAPPRCPLPVAGRRIAREQRGDAPVLVVQCERDRVVAVGRRSAKNGGLHRRAPLAERAARLEVPSSRREHEGGAAVAALCVDGDASRVSQQLVDDRPVAGGARELERSLAGVAACLHARAAREQRAHRLRPIARRGDQQRRPACAALHGVEVALRRGGVHRAAAVVVGHGVLAQRRQQLARERQFARRPPAPCECRLQRHRELARERPARRAHGLALGLADDDVGALLDREEVARLEARRSGGGVSIAIDGDRRRAAKVCGAGRGRVAGDDRGSGWRVRVRVEGAGRGWRVEGGGWRVAGAGRGCGSRVRVEVRVAVWVEGAGRGWRVEGASRAAGTQRF